MAYNVTVSSLIQGSKYRSNKERSRFITDDEWLYYVNQSWKELYDLIVTTYQNYYLSSYEFSTTGSQDSYDLPEDFLKLNGVEQKLGPQQWVSSKRFEWKERNRFRNSLIALQFPFQTLLYCEQDDKLHLIPMPQGNQTMRIWYVPRAKNLTTSATPADDEVNEINCFNGWEEFIITKSAMWALLKEESFEGAQALATMCEKIKVRIMDAANNRDQLAPERVIDVESMNGGTYDNLGWWK